MRYNLIRKMDISNGPGVRVSVFMQGCSFHCKNCFNPETWDFEGGKEFTDETIEKVIELCSKEHVKGLSILGGEPMHPKNIDATTNIDVLIDGVYKDELHDPTLKWRGSSNQRVIDVQKSIKEGKVVMLKNN